LRLKIIIRGSADKLGRGKLRLGKVGLGKLGSGRVGRWDGEFGRGA